MKRYTPQPDTHGRINWCGPYALAVICRTSYDIALECCKRGNGKSRVQRMYISEILRGRDEYVIKHRPRKTPHAINVKRLTAYGLKDPKGLTMTQWYKERHDKQGIYLVFVTGHYLVVHGTKIIDNQSKEWEPFHARRKYKSSRIKQVWEIRYA